MEWNERKVGGNDRGETERIKNFLYKCILTACAMKSFLLPCGSAQRDYNERCGQERSNTPSWHRTAMPRDGARGIPGWSSLVVEAKSRSRLDFVLGKA